MNLDDLTKPNPYTKKPLFEGLPWTADDFKILFDFLSAELIPYVEDGEGPLNNNAMDRLLGMRDECANTYAKSECAQYRKEWFHVRKAIRDLERERNAGGVSIKEQAERYKKLLKNTEDSLEKMTNTICFKDSSPTAFRAFDQLKESAEKYRRIVRILTEATEDQITAIMGRPQEEDAKT